MKGYIYKYEFPDGSIYIGQTQRDILKRHKEHINENTGKGNRLLWDKFKEYGTNILPDVIEEVSYDNDKEKFYTELNLLEKQHISKTPKAKSLNIKSGGGMRDVTLNNMPYDGKWFEQMNESFNASYKMELSKTEETVSGICKKFMNASNHTPLTNEELSIIDYCDSRMGCYGIKKYISNDNCFHGQTSSPYYITGALCVCLMNIYSERVCEECSDKSFDEWWDSREGNH